MRRFAICIGNNEYQYLPPLSCAVADASCQATDTFDPLAT